MAEEDCGCDDNMKPQPRDNSDYMEAATYANVYKARTATNESYNVAYYLNSGSLDGDTLLKEILHVITCCELANLKVIALLSDAGGSNTRAYTLLTEGQSLINSFGFLPKKAVSFCNPLQPDSYIFIILCIVHGLKNVRNQFYSSRPVGEGSRHLLNSGYKIQWNQIQELYNHLESNQKMSRNVRELPKLKFDAVNLDTWKKMNVSYAKVIFESDTINYQLNLVRERSGLPIDFFDNVNAAYYFKTGFEAELLLEKISLLKQKLFSDTVVYPVNANEEKLKDDVTQIEFSVNIHYIFISRFLNGKANLTKKEEVRKRNADGTVSLNLNIEKERKRMLQCIQYFDEWSEWVSKQKPATWNVDKIHRLFISKETYRNLKISITGFLHYAENILITNQNIDFVPFLHANQSSIEAFFSTVRASKRDNAQTIGKSLLTANLKGTTKMVSRKSTSYSNNDIVDKNNYAQEISLDPKVGPMLRNQWLKKQIESRVVIDTNSEDTNSVGLFPLQNEQEDPSVLKLIRIISKDRKECFSSFSGMLLKNDMFCEFAKISSIGAACTWFQTIIHGRKEKELSQLCHKINMKLIRILASVTKIGRNNSLHHEQIWKLVNNRTLDGLIDKDASHGDRMGIIVLIQILFDILGKCLWDGIQIRANSQKKEGEKEVHYRDVNKILGWAVFHARKTKILTKNRLDSGCPQYTILENDIEFLSNMTMYKSEAALSDTYLEKYCDSFMRTNDRGYLTLIREEYFEFGYQLLDIISSAFTPDKLVNTEDILKKEKQALLENKGLMKKFLDSSKGNSIINEEGKIEIFELLVKKVCNVVFEDALKRFRTVNTARGTRNTITGLGFRQEIQAQGRKKSKKEEIRKDT